MIRAAEGIEIPNSLADWCDPPRMALLVYDMQIGICRQIADAATIVERVGVVLEAARSAGMRVAFTRHLSLPRKWMGATQLRTAMAWQRRDDPDAVEPWFLPDGDAVRIIPELKPRPDEAVFDKLTMSAFDSTALGYAFRDCGLCAVALAGIAMEIGIEPTARQATDNGFTAVVIEDACGFGDREARDRSIATLEFIGEAILTDVEKFCMSLKAAAT
jgi:nicotinamidase-related amidase